MKWRMAIAVAFVATPVAAQVAPGLTELSNAAGPWSPPGSDVTFPERTGDFQRTRIVRYGPENWSVGYDRIRDKKKLSTTTVFLYASSRRPCIGEFDGAIEAIATTYPTAVEVSRAAVDSPEGGRPDAARRARHRVTAKFDGADQEVLSDTYVYCHPESRWTIKYRSTRPAAMADGEDAAPELLRAINWPAALAE